MREARTNRRLESFCSHNQPSQNCVTRKVLTKEEPINLCFHSYLTILCLLAPACQITESVIESAGTVREADGSDVVAVLDGTVEEQEGQVAAVQGADVVARVDEDLTHASLNLVGVGSLLGLPAQEHGVVAHRHPGGGREDYIREGYV